LVAYVFLPKEAASPHLEALKEEARWQAEQHGLKEQYDLWWDCRGDEIFFAFAKSEKGRGAAVAFVLKCVRLGIPHRGEWPGD
jgi:hypothetical protein